MSEKGGIFVGDSHANGGIPLVVVETGQHIEVEGKEPLIPAEVLQKTEVNTREGTNKEILHEINKEAGVKGMDEKATEIHAGDAVVCVRSTEDKTERKYTGTDAQIVSAINESGGCNNIASGGVEIKPDGAMVQYENGGDINHLDNSEKTSNFKPSITKKEVQDVITGKSKVRNGDVIQSTSSYLRRSAVASGEIKGSKLYKRQEAERLEEYISDNDLWLTSINLKSYLSQGHEQKVYLINEQKVGKLNSGIFYNSWEDYLNNLLLHNYFFPDTAYELVGFIKNEKNELLASVEQPYVKMTNKTDLGLVKNIMAESGFVNTRNNDYFNSELGITLEDLHDENVLTKDSVLFFIDTVFYIEDNVLFDNGGQVDNSKDKNNFNQNITKDELRNVLSGKSKIRHGDDIQSASAYIRRNAGTGSTGRKPNAAFEEEKLIEYINENNLWYKESLNSSNFIERGGEQFVYYAPNSIGFVVKTNNAIYYDFYWSKYLNNLLLHNYFFPDTSYELIGFIRSSEGSLMSVVKQPFIDADENTDVKKIEKFLLGKGFLRTHPRFNMYVNKELGIELCDLHYKNVLIKDNFLYFTDTEFFIDWDVENGEEFKEGGKVGFDPNNIPSAEKFNFAERIRAYYPKVWFLGGNTNGNKAFYHLRNVIKRGYWLEEERWIYFKWKAYHSQHHKDYRIQGIIAMMKWLGGVNEGWGYMKEEVMKEVRKVYPNKTQFLPLSESKGGVRVSRMEDGGVLNEIGGYRYSEEQNKIAKKVDLLTLPKGVEGTNCFNCVFIKKYDNHTGFCINKDIQLPVTSKMCCALWYGEGSFRSWEDHKK